MTEEQKARRYGNFTSSEIIALMSTGSRPMTPEELADNKKANPKSQKKNIDCWPGDAALTYIRQTNMERRLGRALDNEATARALSWGKCCEIVAHDRLSADYTFCANTTLQHPDISYWLGSPDVTAFDNQVVGDIKCPMTLQAFCEMLDEDYYGHPNDRPHKRTIEACVSNHKNGAKYRTQIISNACITGATRGHLIVYVPYRKDLDLIRERAGKLTAAGETGYSWITYADYDELPWITDNCKEYSDLNIIEFDITPAMKEELTSFVLKAGDKLIPWPKPLTSLS